MGHLIILFSSLITGGIRPEQLTQCNVETMGSWSLQLMLQLRLVLCSVYCADVSVADVWPLSGYLDIWVKSVSVAGVSPLLILSP